MVGDHAFRIRIGSLEKPCTCLRVAASAKPGRHLGTLDSEGRIPLKGLHEAPLTITFPQKIRLTRFQKRAYPDPTTTLY